MSWQAVVKLSFWIRMEDHEFKGGYLWYEWNEGEETIAVTLQRTSKMPSSRSVVLQCLAMVTSLFSKTDFIISAEYADVSHIKIWPTVGIHPGVRCKYNDFQISEIYPTYIFYQLGKLFQKLNLSFIICKIGILLHTSEGNYKDEVT